MVLPEGWEVIVIILVYGHGGEAIRTSEGGSLFWGWPGLVYTDRHRSPGSRLVTADQRGANVGHWRGNWEVGSSTCWEGFFSGSVEQKTTDLQCRVCVAHCLWLQWTIVYSQVMVILHATQRDYTAWIDKVFYPCQRLETKKVYSSTVHNIIVLYISYSCQISFCLSAIRN